MKVDEHEHALQEHTRNLNRLIDEGVEENQRNIGYNVSQGAVELFAIYLHSLHLIEGSGDQWDHRIFKNRQKVDQKVSFDFPQKVKIFELMRIIENERNLVCYGKRKPRVQIERMLSAFHELRSIITVGLKK